MNFSKAQIFLIALVLGIISGTLIANWANKAERFTYKKNRDEILSILYEVKLKAKNDSIKYTNEIDRLVIYIDEMYDENQ